MWHQKILYGVNLFCKLHIGILDIYFKIILLRFSPSTYFLLTQTKAFYGTAVFYYARAESCTAGKV